MCHRFAWLGRRRWLFARLAAGAYGNRSRATPSGWWRAYFQLGAALELAGDPREARRAFGAAGLAMVSGDGTDDISGLGGYTRRDLASAIAYKLTAEMR